MIEVVKISNSHLFDGNPIYAQHVLRYESNIKRQSWDVPTVDGMEYDSYDNPAAYYFVKRDDTGNAIGCARLYPTDRPYMLEQAFSHLVTKTSLPKSSSVWEGSRFCVDRKLSPAERLQVSRELVLSYIEFGVLNNLDEIVGVMFPIYWKNLFVKNGWNVLWMGEMHRSHEGHKIIAGRLPVSEAVLENVRGVMGVEHSILDFGELPDVAKAA